MINQELAKIFEEIADILEMKEVDWKPAAYRKAARSIDALSEDVSIIFEKGGIKALREIPGVGESIADKIIEFIKTGKVKEFEKLKKSIPSGLEELMHVPGMGPKRAFLLYKRLKIKGVKDLEQAAKAGKIRKLKGFGEKSEQDILRGIGLIKKGAEIKLLGFALPIARNIVEELKKLKEVKKAEIAGSLRRMKETVRDIDILTISNNPKKVMDYFTGLKEVNAVLAKGATKSTVMLKNGMQADVRVLQEKSFGSALNYFTGSKEHNVKLRQIAIKKGYKLSEYGLFDRKTDRFVAGRTEEDLYNKLGLPYIEPELRENTGEIEAGYKKKLPDLISYNDLKGDLHMHSNYSDGANSIEEMALAAKNLGLQYIAMTDHSKSEHIAHGMDEKRLLKYLDEIDKLNKKLESMNFHILKGAEVDILADGSLDYSNEILKKLDIVLISIHSRFKASKEEMTKRILKAFDNKYAAILTHPTGRLINERAPYEADFDKLFAKAKANNIFIEVDSFPSRLDLKDSHIRTALDYGVELSIDSDSHNKEHFRFLELGIAQARRGWCSKKNVINTLSFDKLMKKIGR